MSERETERECVCGREGWDGVEREGGRGRWNDLAGVNGRGLNVKHYVRWVVAKSPVYLQPMLVRSASCPSTATATSC